MSAKPGMAERAGLARGMGYQQDRGDASTTSRWPDWSERVWHMADWSIAGRMWQRLTRNIAATECGVPSAPYQFFARLSLRTTTTITHRELRDSSGYDSLGFARHRGIRSWTGLDCNHAPQIPARKATLCKRYHRRRVGVDRTASTPAGQPRADAGDRPARCRQCDLLHRPILAVSGGCCQVISRRTRRCSGFLRFAQPWDMAGHQPCAADGGA